MTSTKGLFYILLSLVSISVHSYAPSTSGVGLKVLPSTVSKNVGRTISMTTTTSHRFSASTQQQQQRRRLYMSTVEGDFDPDSISKAKEEIEAGSMKARLRALYKFTRPHTIRGTILASIAGTIRALVDTPGAIANANWSVMLPRAFIGMAALLLGNAFIVGINQIYDKDIDKLNESIELKQVYIEQLERNTSQQETIISQLETINKQKEKRRKERKKGKKA